MDLPQRKHPRLKSYDYSTPGAYFITICTQNKKCLLSQIVGRGLAPAETVLTACGQVAKQQLLMIPSRYPGTAIEHFVIMPNHIHLLLRVCADEYGRPLVAPTMSRVVKQLKGVVSKQAGISIWQKSFHDHIIRNREDYEEHSRYIYENPMRWYYDELYAEE